MGFEKTMGGRWVIDGDEDAAGVVLAGSRRALPQKQPKGADYSWSVSESNQLDGKNTNLGLTTLFLG